MSYQDSLDPAQHAKRAAVEAVAAVVDKHLRHEAVTPTVRDDPDAPVLLHVDGPGKSQFLDALEQRLDPFAPVRGRYPGTHESGPAPWSAIRFDAWQHQRLAPPWWWLVNALDRQLRQRHGLQGRRVVVRKRLLDLAFRGRCLAKDLLWVLPGLLVFALVAPHLADVNMQDFAKEVGSLVGGVAALTGAVAAIVAFASSVLKAMRRHLLSESPAGARALLRSTDPMADVLRRYCFLVRSADTPIVVLIDNLDRCQAEYVVAMLEGIQTLMRVPARGGRGGSSPLVAFVVAADERWLCDSYLQVYGDFAATAQEAGRPFGLAFLDKIFDVSLRLPTVPSATTMRSDCAIGAAATPNRFEGCHSEMDVRVRLRELEKDLAPLHEARLEAVEYLGQLETSAPHRDGLGRGRHCQDTARVLSELIGAADLGPVVTKRIESAYCVQRTTQLLGGHALQAQGAAPRDDDEEIRRLGLWTMLAVRWPLLAKHLAESPRDLEQLRQGRAPEAIDAALAPAFTAPDAVRLAAGLQGVRLTAHDIRRYSTPLASAASVRPGGRRRRRHPRGQLRVATAA